MDNIKIIFVDLYRDQLKKPYTSIVECDFDDYFDQQVRELEGTIERSIQEAPQVRVDDYSSQSIDQRGIEQQQLHEPSLLPGLRHVSLFSSQALLMSVKANPKPRRKLRHLQTILQERHRIIPVHQRPPPAYWQAKVARKVQHHGEQGKMLMQRPTSLLGMSAKSNPKRKLGKSCENGMTTVWQMMTGM